MLRELAPGETVGLGAGAHRADARRRAGRAEDAAVTGAAPDAPALVHAHHRLRRGLWVPGAGEGRAPLRAPRRAHRGRLARGPPATTCSPARSSSRRACPGSPRARSTSRWWTRASGPPGARSACVDAGGRTLLAPGQRPRSRPFLGPRRGRLRHRARARRAGAAQRHLPRARPLRARRRLPRARRRSRGGSAPRSTDPVRLPWPRAERRAGGGRGRDARRRSVRQPRHLDPRGGPRRASRSPPPRWEGGRRAGCARSARAAPGELLALAGSGGRVEVAVREGSAAAALGARAGRARCASSLEAAGSAC